MKSIPKPRRLFIDNPKWMMNYNSGTVINRPFTTRSSTKSLVASSKKANKKDIIETLGDKTIKKRLFFCDPSLRRMIPTNELMSK